MAASGLTLAVRFLHVFFGLAWVGGLVFFGHVFLGGPRSLPETERGTLLSLGYRKLTTFGLAAGPLTLLFGLATQQLTYGSLAFRGSTANVALGAAFGVTLVMIGLHALVGWPALQELDVHGRPPDALQRLRQVALANTALGLVAVGLMVVAAG